jgi:hypothetical protein
VKLDLTEKELNMLIFNAVIPTDAKVVTDEVIKNFDRKLKRLYFELTGVKLHKI